MWPQLVTPSSYSIWSNTKHLISDNDNGIINAEESKIVAQERNLAMELDRYRNTKVKWPPIGMISGKLEGKASDSTNKSRIVVHSATNDADVGLSAFRSAQSLNQSNSIRPRRNRMSSNSASDLELEFQLEASSFALVNNSSFDLLQDREFDRSAMYDTSSNMAIVEQQYSGILDNEILDSMSQDSREQ